MYENRGSVLYKKVLKVVDFICWLKKKNGCMRDNFLQFNSETKHNQ